MAAVVVFGQFGEGVAEFLRVLHQLELELLIVQRNRFGFVRFVRVALLHMFHLAAQVPAESFINT